MLHQYTVSVDATLTELAVAARFATPTASVTARGRDAAQFLNDVEDCDNERRLRMRNKRMLLPATGIRCLNYRVDLRAAAAAERRNSSLSAGNALISPSLWLWRPDLTPTTRLRVRFELPAGIRVAVPWLPVDGGDDEYILGPSPESANAPVLFGRFVAANVRVPGAELTLSLPQTDPPLDREGIIDWLQAAAGDVAVTYGRFPNPSAHIVVIPISEARITGQRAVPFGRVIRDGGEIVELFVNRDQPIERYFSDWTATHEFSHLMLPYVDRAHRWISEGFAQYYQNVLMARTGAYTEAEAWQNLSAGLSRGRAARPELSPNAAAAGRVRGARMKIYWAGASLALMADVALRERSDNRESLDAVLARLQTCCLPSADTWTGPELFAQLDALLSEPLFAPLYRRYADTVGFPDARPLLERLGVQVEKDSIRLRDAELVDIRRAITAVEPAAAARRSQLAKRAAGLY